MEEEYVEKNVPVLKNWIILVSILLVVGGTIYYLYTEGIPTEAIPRIDLPEMSVPKLNNPLKKSESSDNQNNLNTVEEIVTPPAVVVDEKVIETESGNQITVQTKQDGNIDPYSIKWDEDSALRYEMAGLGRVGTEEQKTNYVGKVLDELSSGGMTSVLSDCQKLEKWYRIYYHGGSTNVDKLYSANKILSDYLKGHLKEKNCEFEELPEHKEFIDAQNERIEQAVANATKAIEESK